MDTTIGVGNFGKDPQSCVQVLEFQAQGKDLG